MTISPTDIIFATLLSYTGATLVEARLQGVSSVAEVMQRLRSMVASSAPARSLRLRNFTSGQWERRFLGGGPSLRSLKQ